MTIAIIFLLAVNTACTAAIAYKALKPEEKKATNTAEQTEQEKERRKKAEQWEAMMNYSPYNKHEN